MARKLASFIDGFMSFTEGKGSPQLYRLWTAIGLVSAVCERKVWIKNAKGQLFPNQYIILVGPPGIGKSLCTNIAQDFLSEIHTPETPFFCAPSSVTKASLIDALANAERRVVRPTEIPAVHSFNSLAIVPNEFGVFLPGWDSDFMNVLTDLWDCKIYSETRRTAKINIKMPRTQLSMLSATTPAYLTTLLPEGAWETGFMSRTICIYSGELIHVDLFAEFLFDDSIHDSLLSDLRDIHRMWGALEVTDDAREAITSWGLAGGPPIPDHPKLMHYNSRRMAHLLKLCMVACVARSDEYIVDLEDFAEALDWLTQAERAMPDIFKSMRTSGDARAMDECWHFVYQIWMKKQEPIAEHRIVAFLSERTPAHNVARVLGVMEQGGLLEKKFTSVGGTGYVPKSRRVA